MTLETGEVYYAFTFADLKAGNVAFLAGDGLQAGEGERIAFKVQAVDDDGNLSDSDDATPGDQAADGSVGVDRAEVAATAGVDGLINEDGVLSPDEATLTVWKQEATTHGATLHVVVKLLDKQPGDALSLQSGYDARQVTPIWDGTKGELSLEIQSGATEADIRTALGTLSLNTKVSNSESVRQVWLFPTLSGLGHLRYRLDASAGLVRYYFHDTTYQLFSTAQSAASARILFGKQGYLGVPASTPERSVYSELSNSLPSGQEAIYLAISDSAREGKWLVTDGPRKGQLFWDHTANPKVYGPGAAGSGWSRQTDFWARASRRNPNPDNYRNQDYATESEQNIRDNADRNAGHISHHDFRLANGEIWMRPVGVGESTPHPVLRVAFNKLQLDPRQRAVLTEDHILVDDVDTVLLDGNIDASKITLRVTGLTGGTLQSRPASDSDTWIPINPSGSAPNESWAFTLEDVRAEKVAFLAGDGVAMADGGEGKKITFRIQAADDGPNLSDSDPSTSNVADPLDVEILIRSSAEIIAGSPGLLNADGLLTPNDATLIAWKQTAITHRTPLYVIVKLFEGETTDALSLRSGYNASKITALWNEKKGELSIRFDNTTTVPEMKTALGLVELRAEVSLSDSARKVWVFPTLLGVSKFAHRVDEAAGLVRYYLHDNVDRDFPGASAWALESILFGKHGYLGTFTSQAEKDIWDTILADDIYVRLGLTDTETEGKWLITAGPRKGQLFWDHVAGTFGPGAAGSGWSVQGDIWGSAQPDDDYGEDYALMTGNEIEDWEDTPVTSMIHYDLSVEKREVFARLVEVAESPSNPIMKVDFGEVLRTAQRHLILTEDHISVDDPDTRDPLDDNKVDASKIELRITNIPDDTLYARISMSAPWVAMTKVISQDYYSFTLAQLQGSLISLRPKAAGTLTFQVQAADDAPHLSDSDPYDPGAQPESISISVVALETVAAGEEVSINGDGALTPGDDTLDAWLTANDALQIFVVLGKGKEGIVTPSAGLVRERLSVGTHSVPDSKIVVKWDPDTWRLSLAAVSSGSAARADFQAVLNALQLQTVHFGQVSHRTISVRPELSGDVLKQEFHVREVEVGASLPNPILEVAFDGLRVDSGQRLVLTEEDILVYDPDTTDASSVWLRITGLTGGELPGGELQLRSTSSASDWTKIVAGGKAYLAFTLAELRAGRIALLAGDGLDSGDGTKVVFRVQAADATDAPGNAPNLSANPLDVEVPVVTSAKAIAGAPVRALINADGALTPGETTFNSWKARTATGTLHLRVGLVDKQEGDVLSLATGYDASKITPDWKESIGELWLGHRGRNDGGGNAGGFGASGVRERTFRLREHAQCLAFSNDCRPERCGLSL